VDERDVGNGSRDSGNENAANKKRKHSTLAVLRTFLNVRNGSWIVTIFFIGLSNGVRDFLYWHLDNLGN